MPMRCSGILAHPTALPGPFNCGELGKESRQFLTLLAEGGQTVWQVLPLGPTLVCPYSGTSCFAINPILISPAELVLQGLLTPQRVKDAQEEWKRTPKNDYTCDDTCAYSGDRRDKVSNFIDFSAVWQLKRPLLREAFTEFQRDKTRAVYGQFEKFCEEAKDVWLDTYVTFTVLHEMFEEKAETWHAWPEQYRKCPAAASGLSELQSGLVAEDLQFQRFLQFEAFSQWHALKKFANSLNIAILGDCAIYPSLHSADTWANTTLFDIDPNTLLPRHVSGVPPDYFSEDGQLWGHPVYDWEKLSQTGYEWWYQRLRVTLTQVDILRIDHFRGLEAFWAVPQNHAVTQRTARVGSWVKAKGEEMLTSVIYRLYGIILPLHSTLPRFAKKLLTEDREGRGKRARIASPVEREATMSSTCTSGKLFWPPIIVEDLGAITDDVLRMTKAFGFPTMKVLQFAFGEDEENYHLPFRYDRHCVVYPGTHDNATCRGWWDAADDKAKRHFASYCGFLQDEELDRISLHAVRLMKQLAMQSVAALAVLPLQDLFELSDDEGRFNDPGQGGNPRNWRWQLPTLHPLLSGDNCIIKGLYAATKFSGRLGVVDAMEEEEREKDKEVSDTPYHHW